MSSKKSTNQKVRKYYKSLEGLTVVVVLGLTFKPGIDDLREAAFIVKRVIDDGPKIKAWNPVGVENLKARS